MHIQTKKDQTAVEKTTIPETIVSIVFIILVISLGFMQPSMRINIVRVQITEIIFLLLLLVFAYALVTKIIKPIWDRSYYFFAFYFFALSVSAVFSSSPRFSIFKLSGEAFLIGLAILTHQIIRSDKILKQTIVVWIFAGTFVSLVGTFTVILFYVDRGNSWHTLFLHHYGSLPPGNYPRVQSTFIYPALLCNYLSVSVMLLLAAFKLKWIGKKYFYLSFLIHLITILFTVTPGIGGVIYSLLAWTAFCLANAGKRGLKNILIGTGSAVTAASVLVSAFTLRHIPTSTFTFELFGTRIDPTQRLLTWQGAAETFLANPLFGNDLGLGVCKVIFLAPSGQRQMLTDAHNIWLNVAGQSGTLGLVAIILLMLYLFYRVRQGLSETIQTSIISQSLYISFVSAVVIQGMTGSFENARHLWVMFGIIISLKTLSRTSDSNTGTKATVQNW